MQESLGLSWQIQMVCFMPRMSKESEGERMDRKTIVIIYLAGFFILSLVSYYMQRVFAVDIHAAYIYIVILLATVMISVLRTSDSLALKIAMISMFIYISIVKGIIEFLGYIGNMQQIDIWSTRVLFGIVIILFILTLFKKKEELPLPPPPEAEVE